MKHGYKKIELTTSGDDDDEEEESAPVMERFSMPCATPPPSHRFTRMFDSVLAPYIAAPKNPVKP